MDENFALEEYEIQVSSSNNQVYETIDKLVQSDDYIIAMKANPVYQVCDSAINMQDNCAYTTQLIEHNNMVSTNDQSPFESNLARDLEGDDYI